MCKNLTGVGDPYEEPEYPDLLIETDKETVEESTIHILTRLEELGYLTPEEVYEVNHDKSQEILKSKG